MKTIVMTLAILAATMTPSLLRAQGGPGIRVTELRGENSPLVTIRIALRAGSINDPGGKEGINALTAALSGSGGTKDLTYAQVMETMYPWAANISSQADHELTTFTGDVHRDHLDQFYKLFTVLVLSPGFDPADFARVKEDAVNYLVNTLRSTDDENLGKQALNAFLFEGHQQRRKR